MNTKGKCFKQTVYFYWNNDMFCGIKSYDTRSNAVCQH